MPASTTREAHTDIVGPGHLSSQAPPVRAAHACAHSAQEWRRKVLAQERCQVSVDPVYNQHRYLLTYFTSSIRTEHRNQIRSRLLESIILEETPQLASLEAVVAAKIARIDFPNTWYTSLDVRPLDSKN